MTIAQMLSAPAPKPLYDAPRRPHRLCIPDTGDTISYISVFGRWNNLTQTPFIIEGKEHIL